MKKILKLFSAVLLVLATNHAYTQQLTGSVRGRVADADSDSPLAGATVTINGTTPLLGASVNESGEFQIDNIPVGRYNITFEMLGYEPGTLSEVMVTSGKIQTVEMRMKEKVAELNEIVLIRKKEKDQPINTMAVVSARQVTMEEANRFAGGFDDPSRLVASYAGVASDLTTNGIVIRGNAPKGLLWRMEGVEIPNPNHFGEIAGFGAGGITALSSQMLANSDFFTGAFPAEYGNALSGVFDLSMRKGNSSKREHTIGAGTMGLDVSSEGPIKKDHAASYLFNYRYSTLALVDYLLPQDLGIKYQDLSCKFHLPSENYGTFSFWGLGFKDNQHVKAVTDSSELKYEYQKYSSLSDILTGVSGLSHKYFLGDNTYVKTTLAASSSKLNSEWKSKNNPGGRIYNGLTDVTLSSFLNHKFSANHTNRSGIVARYMVFNIQLRHTPDENQPSVIVADDKGNSSLFQFYSQSSLRAGKKITINPGIHVQHFALAGKTSVEPRLGIKYQFRENQSVSLGYGKHSRLEKLNFYMTEVPVAGGTELVNKNLDFSKAHHFVIAYDRIFGKNTHLKIEPYYQYLYDVPVIPDSSFSFINLQYDWFIEEKLVNKGKGTNTGVDFTLERFLNKGWYYLVSLSVFDSKYKGGDDVWRNTVYNRRFISNFLAGKEWAVGKNKQNLISLSGKFTYMKGERWTPVDTKATLAEEEVVYDNSRLYENQAPSNYYLHTTITYRRNRKNFSGLWSVQILNTLGTPQYLGYEYNLKDNTIDSVKEVTVIPSISYKIQF
jgi:hypothetical protein